MNPQDGTNLALQDVTTMGHFSDKHTHTQGPSGNANREAENTRGDLSGVRPSWPVVLFVCGLVEK